ncbi:MAG: hypothetical protein WC829_14320 [Hyphomicrobium sp.]|jgi:hypothetical protein
MFANDNPTAIERDAWIDTYTRLTNRWLNVESARAMPVMGVRLLAIRARSSAGIDFDDFLKMISARRGEVERLVCQEYTTRHLILMALVDRQSHLLSAHDLWAVKKGLADDLEAGLSIEGREYLSRFLERLVRRYWRYENETPRVVN